MPVIYNKKVEYAYTDPGVKAHTLSWAEYQALSEDDKMNGDLYFIPDKQPEGNPSRIWTKLGTDPLTTEADDVSGAVNELNSSRKTIKATTPNVINQTTLIYSDSTLYPNYAIVGYSVETNNTYQHWVYNNVVSSIVLDSNGINMNITNAVIENKTVYIFLEKIN